MSVFVLGLGAFGVLLWLAVPPHSTPYHLLPDEHEEKPEQELNRDQIKLEMFSSESISSEAADLDEYHCGWVYMNFEFTEVPPINLRLLQDMRGAGSRPNGIFFLVLNQGSLFLYDSESQENCLGVTQLNGFLVECWPHSLLLDEVYRKDYPLRITNPNGAILGSMGSSCFMYAANASEKEDWLIALRRAVGGVSGAVKVAREALDFLAFMKSSEARIVEGELDGTGQLISALLARTMFNVHRAAEVEAFIREKFVKRTETLLLPFFLGPLKLDAVDVGRCAPVLGNGRLHSAAHNGELIGSLDISYGGGLTLQISTSVTKPVFVPIVIRVAVKRLSGRVMVKIKGPPSDRLWFGFYRLPDYEIDVEPVVSSVALTWGPIQRAIAGQIEAGLKEFVVLPNMDELPLPPLVSGALFIGERPFELAPVPPVALEHIVDRTSYTAEGLSRRRSPTPVLPLDSLDPEQQHHIIHDILKSKSYTELPSASQRKIFVSVGQSQLLSGSGSPLLESLQPEENTRCVHAPNSSLDDNRPHVD